MKPDIPLEVSRRYWWVMKTNRCVPISEKFWHNYVETMRKAPSAGLRRMISLKRYLEQSSEKLPRPCADAHVAMLEAITASALRCCPPTGEVLERELSVATDPLKQERTTRVFKSSQQKVLKSLCAWGEESEAYFRRKTAEVKEMLTELANTAESIGKRDRRYTQQFHEITSSLQTIAQLDDLGRIKSCVLNSAGELKCCVDRMVREEMSPLPT